MVRTADAGRSDAYAGAVPVQIVLLVGIFGNISDADLLAGRPVFAPQLCASGATLLWSRGLDEVGRNEQVRVRLVKAGFTELDYSTSGGDDAAALGCCALRRPAGRAAAGTAAVHMLPALKAVRNRSRNVSIRQTGAAGSGRIRTSSPSRRSGRAPPDHRR